MTEISENTSNDFTHNLQLIRQPSVFLMDLFNIFNNFPEKDVIEAGSNFTFQIDLYKEIYMPNAVKNKESIVKLKNSTSTFSLLFSNFGDIILTETESDFKQFLIRVGNKDSKLTNYNIPNLTFFNKIYETCGFKLEDNKFIFMSNNAKYLSYVIDFEFEPKALYLTNYKIEKKNILKKNIPSFTLLTTDFDLSEQLEKKGHLDEDNNYHFINPSQLKFINNLKKGYSHELTPPNTDQSIFNDFQSISQYFSKVNKKNQDNVFTLLDYPISMKNIEEKEKPEKIFYLKDKNSQNNNNNNNIQKNNVTKEKVVFLLKKLIDLL